MSIRIGILGYGNLGRGVECAIRQNPDMELAAVFTRRAPETGKILTEGVKVYHVDEAEKMKDEIDVQILCGGSATDLPEQTPEFAQWFNCLLYTSGEFGGPGADATGGLHASRSCERGGGDSWKRRKTARRRPSRGEGERHRRNRPGRAPDIGKRADGEQCAGDRRQMELVERRALGLELWGDGAEQR